MFQMKKMLAVLLCGVVSWPCFAAEKAAPAVGTKVSKPVEKQADPCDVKAKAPVNGVRELDWLELMPKAECDALVNAPVDHGTGPDVPLSLEDQMSSALDQAAKQKAKPVPKQAAVIAELNNVMAKIPGFIVPIEIDKENKIHEFFLVPYFGACIHVPPPPPNQIVYVKANKALAMETMYEPVWVTGLLRIERKESDIATAMYSMGALKVEVYREPGVP